MENDTALTFKFDMPDALAIAMTINKISGYWPQDRGLRALIVKFQSQIRISDQQAIKMELLEFITILAHLMLFNKNYLKSEYIDEICNNIKSQLLMNSTAHGMLEANDEQALKTLLREAGITGTQ